MDAKAKPTDSVLRRAHAPMEAWELVGNTPLLRPGTQPPGQTGVEIYAKPNGSTRQLRQRTIPRQHDSWIANARAGLTPGKVILDATSGNTGIAYAWIGASRGYKVKLALPQNASEERKRILRSYGAGALF